MSKKATTVVGRWIRGAGWMVVALALLAGCNPWRVFRPTQADRFFSREVVEGNQRYGYQVFAPVRRDAGARLPVILFLHGSGESGADNLKQTQVGLGPEVWRRRAEFPFLVVFPQCRAGALWSSPDMERQTLAALDAAIGEFGGDPARVYLIGNSLGGYGTWVLAMHHPERFAAIVPIAGAVVRPGWTPYPDDARVVPRGQDPRPVVADAIARARVPVWIFHGDDDAVVPVREARRMRALLAERGLGGDGLRYTEWPGAGHAQSWELTYPRPELYEWLLSFQQNRRIATASPDAEAAGGARQ